MKLRSLVGLLSGFSAYISLCYILMCLSRENVFTDRFFFQACDELSGGTTAADGDSVQPDIAACRQALQK